MITLNQIVQKIKFKPKFDLEHRFDYKNNVQEVEKKSEKASLIFVVTYLISLPVTILISSTTPASYESSILLGLWAPILFSLIIPTIASLFYRSLYKDQLNTFKQNEKLRASCQSEFETALFTTVDSKDKLIALFQAFESEPSVKHNFNFAQLFHEANEILNHKHEKRKIARLLAPVFEQFLTAQYRAQHIHLGSDEKIKNHYQDILSKAQQKSEESEFLFSNHSKPLSVKSLHASTH